MGSNPTASAIHFLAGRTVRGAVEFRPSGQLAILAISVAASPVGVVDQAGNGAFAALRCGQGITAQLSPHVVFHRPKRLNIKTPALQLCAGDARFLGHALHPPLGARIFGVEKKRSTHGPVPPQLWPQGRA